MNRVVLGVLMVGASLLLMSIGILMIGASLLLFFISNLAFPTLREFIPDIEAFVDILRRRLRGILFDKSEGDVFRNREPENSKSYYYNPKHTEPEKPEPYYYNPNPKEPVKPKPPRSPGPAPAAPQKPKDSEKPKPKPAPPPQKPKPAPPPFVDQFNKIKTFDITDQGGDSD